MDSSKVNKEELVTNFMKMLNTVKLYHWKTYSYAKHQATDVLYKDLNKYIDEFIEVLLGKYQTRIPAFDTSISLQNLKSPAGLKKEIHSYRNFLVGLEKVLHQEKDSDLLSIRDEILASLNQFLYLSSFKP